MENGNLTSPTADIAKLVPALIARELRVVLIADWHRVLVVGSDSPLSKEASARLEFPLNRHVRGIVRSTDA